MNRRKNLFAYGTLKRGQPQGALLAGTRSTPAAIRGRLYRLPAGYPALVVDGAAGWVRGELFHDVDDRLWPLLDLYEGVAEGLFQRIDDHAVIGLRREPARLYVMTDPERHGGTLLPRGIWKGVVRRGPR